MMITVTVSDSNLATDTMLSVDFSETLSYLTRPSWFGNNHNMLFALFVNELFQTVYVFPRP